jgi:hypothetical protein
MSLSRVARTLGRVVLGLLFAANAHASAVRVSEPDTAALRWMQAVLDGWDVTARRNLRITTPALPWIVFYDEAGAWHLNAESGRLSAAAATKSTLRFGTRRYPLAFMAHSGKFWVPDGDSLPAVPRASTLLYSKNTKAFSAVPLPALFRQMGAPEDADELDKLFVTLAIHELTHTRQLVDIDRRIVQLRPKYHLLPEIDDDVIENRFSMDTAYTPLYGQERAAFNEAVFAKTPAEAKAAARRALDLVDQRRREFMGGPFGGYAELDDYFLVLEGTGMWAQFEAAKRAAPKGEPWQQTLAMLMNRTGSWSQGEGLVLFVLLDRFRPNWQATFMAPGFPSPFATLKAALR